MRLLVKPMNPGWANASTWCCCQCSYKHEMEKEESGIIYCVLRETSEIFNSLMLIRGMCDGSRPRFTASLPRRFYGRVINFHVEKPRGPAAGMFRGSQRWWIRIHDVIYGPSEMFWAGDLFSIPRPAIPGPFLKRSFVLIAAIDRSSARRSFYVCWNRWQVSCLYRFNVPSALALIASAVQITGFRNLKL